MMVLTYNITGLLFDYITTVISIPISVSILWYILRLYKFEENNYIIPMKIVIMSLIPSILVAPIMNSPSTGFLILFSGLIGIFGPYILSFVLIKKYYKQKTIKLLFVWVIYSVINSILLIILEILSLMVATYLNYKILI